MSVAIVRAIKLVDDQFHNKMAADMGVYMDSKSCVNELGGRN